MDFDLLNQEMAQKREGKKEEPEPTLEEIFNRQEEEYERILKL
jgi:hypothetical protein